MSSGPRSRGPNGPEAGLAWGLHALESLAHRLLWEPTLFSHGVLPSSDQRRSSRVTCRRQHRNCLQLKVRHQRAIRRFPKHLFLRLRSYKYSHRLRRTQKERSRTTLSLTSGLNRQNVEVGKSASKAKSLILRSVPEPLMLWVGEDEDDKSNGKSHYFFFHDMKTNTRLRDSGLQADSGKPHRQATSKSKLPQPKEKLNPRSDRSRANELFG